MNGGYAMDVVRTRLNASQIASIIQLPDSLINKDVMVTVSECKPSVVEDLYGIASNVSMTLDEIRDERLAKQ
ncbi:MAG: hypothetical protein K6E81_06870 [Lachnospiraceae bacterium]|nr:hypothetical protein [Lachnospiraceae bacterium]